MSDMPGRAEIIEALRPVQDPELHVSIVELGLVYDVRINQDTAVVTVDLTLTSPSCPLGPEILAAVTKVVKDLGFADAKVNLVWEPKWDPHIMASDEAKDHLGIW